MFKFNKKISLSHALIVSSLILNILIQIFSIYTQVRGISKDLIETQKSEISIILDDIIQSLNYNPENLKSKLELWKNKYVYSFYLVHKNGIYFDSSSQKRLGKFDLKKIPNEIINLKHIEKKHTMFLTRKQSGEYDILLGIDMPVFSFEVIDFSYYIWEILYLILSIYITIFFLNDILKPISYAQNRDNEKLLNYKAFTKEGFIANKMAQLKDNSKKKSYHIPDAMEYFLNTYGDGEKNMNCVVFRVDLNESVVSKNFFGEEFVNKYKDSMLEGMREIAQLYGAYQERKVGDEKIFIIFSDNRTEALKLAADLNKKTFEFFKKGHPNFTFKSSISYGNLKFLMSEGKYEFNGSAFESSSRYIEVFKNRKDINKKYTLAMSSEEANEIKDLIEQPEEVSIELSGIGKVDLCFIRNFKDQTHNINNWKYLRSNEDLLVIMEQILSKEGAEFESLFWTFFKFAINIKIIKKDNEFQTYLFHILNNHKSYPDNVIASTVSLVGNFVDENTISQNNLNKLKEFLNHPNQRVRENSLDIISKFENISALAEQKLKTGTRREKGIAANLLAQKKLTQEIYEQIKEFLSSESEHDIFAGFYSSNAIFQFYSDEDLSYMKKNVLFEDILDSIKELSKSKNERVSVAASKIILKYEKYIL